MHASHKSKYLCHVFLLVLPHQGWQHLDHLDEITLQGNLLTEVPHTLAELKVQTATHDLFALLTAADLSSVTPPCLPAATAADIAGPPAVVPGHRTDLSLFPPLPTALS